MESNIPYPYSDVGYYEERYNLKESHDALLTVLVAFDKFCRANGIHYSLADGTLLGAVRHGDFIPWDDDADVMVTRDEYKKIRKSIQKTSEIKLMKIRFLDRVTIPELIDKGIYIDLFINDEMPRNAIVFTAKRLYTLFLRCYFVNNGMMNFHHSGESSLKSQMRRIIGGVMKKLVRLYVGNRSVFEVNDNGVQINNSNGSGIYTRYTSRMYETKRRFDKDKYNMGYRDICFRDRNLMTIENVDYFLSEMYGDYQMMPSEESRKPEHGVNMLTSPDYCVERYN